MRNAYVLIRALSLQSEKISVTVYSSDWYVRDIKEVGFYVQMIIVRTSNPITFSGAGLLLLSRTLWLNVSI